MQALTAFVSDCTKVRMPSGGKRRIMFVLFYISLCTFLHCVMFSRQRPMVCLLFAFFAVDKAPLMGTNNKI